MAKFVVAIVIAAVFVIVSAPSASAEDPVLSAVRRAPPGTTVVEVGGKTGTLVYGHSNQPTWVVKDALGNTTGRYAPTRAQTNWFSANIKKWSTSTRTSAGWGKAQRGIDPHPIRGGFISRGSNGKTM